MKHMEGMQHEHGGHLLSKCLFSCWCSSLEYFVPAPLPEAPSEIVTIYETVDTWAPFSR